MRTPRENRLRAMVISAAMAAMALTLPVAFHAVGLGSHFLTMLLPLLVNGFLVPVRWAVFTGAAVPLQKAELFVRKAVRPTDRLILDVGCGTGILLGPLLESGCPGRRIVEMDIAEEMLQENRRKRAQQGIDWLCADALDLPFAPDSFDAVLCFGVLPHLGSLEAGLAGLLRCLQKGGTLAVGHLMGSENLNAFHASLAGPVNQDRLPSASVLSDVLRRLGSAPLRAEEAPDWYLVRAEKRG